MNVGGGDPANRDKSAENAAVGARLTKLVGSDRVRSIADIAGVSELSLRRWMKGDGSADAMGLARIAKYYGVSVDWLVTGEGEQKPTLARDDQTWVPIYDGKLAAGDGGMVYEGEATDHLALPTSFLKSVGVPDKMHIVPVQGDSMAPEINHGDWAIIDSSQRRATENVFAFNLEGSALIKRLRLLGDGKAQLVSVNPAYPPIEVRLDSDQLIVGRVVYSLRRQM